MVLFAAFIPVSGYLADRFGRRRFLIAVTGAHHPVRPEFRLVPVAGDHGIGRFGEPLGLMLVFLSLGMSLMGPYLRPDVGASA